MLEMAFAMTKTIINLASMIKATVAWISLRMVFAKVVFVMKMERDILVCHLQHGSGQLQPLIQLWPLAIIHHLLEMKSAMMKLITKIAFMIKVTVAWISLTMIFAKVAFAMKMAQDIQVSMKMDLQPQP